jgi:hypothetical protein
LLGGCGRRDEAIGPDGYLVGGLCSTDRDCAHRCLRDNSHYPGGMCTVSCRADADCPAGTSCVSDAGGICAVGCRSSGDCAPFGRGYVCQDRDRQGAGGKALVCRVD